MAIEFFYGVVVAVLSILVMAKVVGKLDNVPVLPRNAYEWREFAEYGASIAFGFFTGVIIRQTVIAMRRAGGCAKLAHPHDLEGGRREARRRSGRLQHEDDSILDLRAAAAGSAITSIITGLRPVFLKHGNIPCRKS